jgi:glycerate kinase
LEYTSLELQTFLGQMGVTIGGSGTVDAGAGSAVVTPLQVAVIDTSVDSVVEIGR